MKFLLENKADPNIDDLSDCTVLDLAVDTNNLHNDYFNLLLKYVTNFNMINFFSETPLDTAVLLDQLDRAKILMKAGYIRLIKFFFFFSINRMRLMHQFCLRKKFIKAGQNLTTFTKDY